MSASLIRWTVLALIYASFHIWYGGNGEPLNDAEVEHYVERAVEIMGPEAETMVRDFAASDDGKAFINVNLNKYRDKPEYLDGRHVDVSSAQVEQLYIRDVAPRLFARAGHPLIVVEPFGVLGGHGDFEAIAWDKVTFIRYRSRRDLLEFVLETDWKSDAEHKYAALLANQSMPAAPTMSLVGVRLVPFLLLVCIGLLLDRWFGRKAAQKPSAS